MQMEERGVSEGGREACVRGSNSNRAGGEDHTRGMRSTAAAAIALTSPLAVEFGRWIPALHGGTLDAVSRLTRLPPSTSTSLPSAAPRGRRSVLRPPTLDLPDRYRRRNDGGLVQLGNPRGCRLSTSDACDANIRHEHALQAPSFPRSHESRVRSAFHRSPTPRQTGRGGWGCIGDRNDVSRRPRPSAAGAPRTRRSR